MFLLPPPRKIPFYTCLDAPDLEARQSLFPLGCASDAQAVDAEGVQRMSEFLVALAERHTGGAARVVAGSLVRPRC